MEKNNYDDNYDKNNPFGSRFSDEGLAQGEISDSKVLKFISAFLLSLIVIAIVFIITIDADFKNLSFKAAVDAFCTAIFIAGLTSGGIGASSALHGGRRSGRSIMWGDTYNSSVERDSRTRKERSPFANSHWIILGAIEILLSLGISYGYDYFIKTLG